MPNYTKQWSQQVFSIGQPSRSLLNSCLGYCTPGCWPIILLSHWHIQNIATPWPLYISWPQSFHTPSKCHKIYRVVALSSRCLVHACGKKAISCHVKSELVHFPLQLTSIPQRRGRLKQHIIVKRVWSCYCPILLCIQRWKCKPVWWGQLFGGARNIPQECCLLRILSGRFYGSYMKWTSFTNCSPWTVTLVPIWTYQVLVNYSICKSKYLNVSTQARFDMSLFPPKTLDWLLMTLTSASGLSLNWSMSWSPGKKRNLLCWTMISLICLKMLPGKWRILLQNITVNSSSIILDMQLKSLTVSSQLILTSFTMWPSFLFFSNILSLIYCSNSVRDLAANQFSEFFFF